MADDRMNTTQQFQVPILLIAFNRPDLTQKVFNRIREVKPTKLFISVDGPRNERDKLLVNRVKEIVNNVDWDCEVKTLFQKKNIGMKILPKIYDWFFENVEEGIFIEDDCMPSLDFFRFCEEMLDKYRDDTRIMHISGCSLVKSDIEDSYYFSNYPHVGGWAIWKRAYNKIDLEMKNYKDFRNEKCMKRIYPNIIEREYNSYTLRNKNIEVDTIWHYSIMCNNGLSILPKNNLVKKNGFRKDSTNTTEADSYLSVDTEKLDFPLKHPKFILINRENDMKYMKWILKNKIKKHLKLKNRRKNGN